MDQYAMNNHINMNDVSRFSSGRYDPGLVERSARSKDRHITTVKTGGNMGSGKHTSSVNSSTIGPYVKITEQPASKAIRFRYGCEGRSAGSIPGVNSTPGNKTFPSIKICGYSGRAIAVVSCVTKDPPYKCHPHSLVGKDMCKHGVCTAENNIEDMTITFPGLGIQCVKKKEIEEALEAREELRVDPFRTGFEHKTQPAGIDLYAVRLCFQVFIEGAEKGKFTVPLPPVVSNPIYDKKTQPDLAICKLSHCSAPATGGMEIMLFCEKISKSDIEVVFFEMDGGNMVWRDYGRFYPNDIHKQVGMSLRTPPYRNQKITQPVEVFIQLMRPSDGGTSEALPFVMTPSDTGDPVYAKRKRQKYSTSDGMSQMLHSECINNDVPGNCGDNALMVPQNELIDNQRMDLLKQLQAQAEKSNSVADDPTDLLNGDLNFDVNRMMTNMDSSYLDMLLSNSFDSLLIGDIPENQIQCPKNTEGAAGEIVNNEAWPG